MSGMRLAEWLEGKWPPWISVAMPRWHCYTRFNPSSPRTIGKPQCSSRPWSRQMTGSMPDGNDYRAPEEAMLHLSGRSSFQVHSCCSLSTVCLSPSQPKSGRRCFLASHGSWDYPSILSSRLTALLPAVSPRISVRSNGLSNHGNAKSHLAQANQRPNCASCAARRFNIR